jgi:hypothetical protein
MTGRSRIQGYEGDKEDGKQAHDQTDRSWHLFDDASDGESSSNSDGGQDIADKGPVRIQDHQRQPGLRKSDDS